jgi:hypothetical protein
MSDATASSNHHSSRETDAALDVVLAQVRGILRRLRFGSVTIIVQDGVVVQLDCTEKRRLAPNG